MSVSAASRTATRSASSVASRVEIDWSRAVWSSSPAVTAGFNKLKSWVAMSESLQEKYDKSPDPIDFGSYKKKVRDQELVTSLEQFYKSNQPPPETHEWPQEEQGMTEEKIAYLKELDALHKEFMPVLEQEVDFQKNNRTTAETTIFDMKVNYPLIHEEVEDELERREWFKDTGIGSNK